MTGMQLKVKKVIREGSRIRYFVNNLESLSDVEAFRSTEALLIVEALYLANFVCCDV